MSGLVDLRYCPSSLSTLRSSLNNLRPKLLPTTLGCIHLVSTRSDEGRVVRPVNPSCLRSMMLALIGPLTSLHDGFSGPPIVAAVSMPCANQRRPAARPTLAPPTPRWARLCMGVSGRTDAQRATS